MRWTSKLLLIINIVPEQTTWVKMFMIIWSIYLGTLVIASADQSSSLLALGDSLYHYENYFEAITEYKRFVVFHPDDPRLDDVYSKLGLAYQRTGEWENSIKAFLLSIELSGNKKLKNKNRISIAVTSIAQKNYHFALLELQKVVIFCQDTLLLRQAFFFQTVAYIYMENWQKARNAFYVFTANSMKMARKLLVQKIDSLLVAGNKLKLKSPTTAKWLSTILPGAGQFYNKRYKEALNAFGLNGVNINFIYHLIRKEAYLNASLFFLYAGMRYYHGNRYHAEKEAKEYNSNLINVYKNRILTYLLEFSHEF